MANKIIAQLKNAGKKELRAILEAGRRRGFGRQLLRAILMINKLVDCSFKFENHKGHVGYKGKLKQGFFKILSFGEFRGKMFVSRMANQERHVFQAGGV